jgi:hypothetical protein
MACIITTVATPLTNLSGPENKGGPELQYKQTEK